MISYLKEFKIELKRQDLWKVNEQLKAVYEKHLVWRGKELGKYIKILLNDFLLYKYSCFMNHFVCLIQIKLKDLL